MLLLGVALAAAGLALLVRDAHLLRRLEQLSVDTRFQARGPRASRAASEIVLVTIDDRTFDYMRNHGLHSRWPFPRRYQARLIDELATAGAGTIGYDVELEARRRHPPGDYALYDAITGAGAVVLATTKGRAGDPDLLIDERALRAVGGRAGDARLDPDSDGIVRDAYYWIRLPTFAVAVAETARGRGVPVSWFGGPRRPVPIDWVGPPGSFRTIPFSRVFAGNVPPGELRGKIVLVGAASSVLHDDHQTPVSGTSMPGVEVLANQVATVLEGVPLREAPDSTTVLLVFLLALLVPLAGMRLGTAGVLVVAVAALAAWSVAAQITFDAGTQLDYVDPLAALLLATLGTVLLGLWSDGRERRHLRALFAADSAAVVEGVLHPAGPRPLEPTAIIAGYRIEEAIGRGGMGVVYRATQEELGRAVAVKLIATARAEDPLFRGRFKRESRLAAAIDHPNVIPIYEAGEDDGLLFISMRLVEGSDLAASIARDGPLEPARAVWLVAQLAGALDAAHLRGLVHRDVKPANVLLTRDRPEHLYLTDFGVAKSVGGDEAATVESGWAGTLDYLAPEQIRGEEVGPGVDIYALAGVLHHCLTGEVPFPRDSDASALWAHVNAPPPAPSERAGLPAAIDAVVARGLAKDPADRFLTATELARACALAFGIELPSSVPRRADPAPDPPAPTPPTVVSDQ